VGALALGDLVKSTLGPKGMNKILQSVSSGDTNVTNDGVPILKATQLDNADAADDTSSTLSFLHASRAAFF
jgi:T-complex protein 1 subunit beta